MIVIFTLIDLSGQVLWGQPPVVYGGRKFTFSDLNHEKQSLSARLLGPSMPVVEYHHLHSFTYHR
jgi:hypothetical protein